MKKRIFIAIPSLNIGGAESALIGLLQTLDYSKVQVDLFPYAHKGPFLKYIPKEVNVLPEIKEYALVYDSTILDCLRLRCFKLALAQLRMRIRMKTYVMRTKPRDYNAIWGFSGDEYVHALPSLYSLGKYDLAISFVVPHNYVLDKVNADKILGWIHTDYTKIEINKKLEHHVWERLSRIVAISDEVGCAFAKTFPDLINKITTIENIISTEFVKRRAEEGCPAEYQRFGKYNIQILCSVGRICQEKNYESIPDIARSLKEKGIKFHWFIVGPGDATSIVARAAELDVDDYISFIGSRDNPLPYVKHCSLYVHPSLCEGKSVAIREAQILCKPIVITNFPTARSHIVDGRDGIIVPLENKAIADGIAGLLSDTEKQKEIICYLESHDYGNEQEIEKIYALLVD